MHAKLLVAETPAPKPDAKHALRRADKSPLHWAATRENYEEWGRASGLTLNQYFEREKVLQLTAFAQGAHMSWVLVAANEVNAADPTILASCETFHRVGRLGDQLVNVWVMAAVFVDQAQRGHGYSKHLVTMIRDHWIAQCPDLGVSILYSDVGPRFYDKLGWRVFPSDALVTTVDLACMLSTPDSDTPSFEYLDAATAASICGAAWTQAREHVHTDIDGRQVFAIPLDATCIEWHEANTRFYYAQREHGDPRATLHPHGTDTVGIRTRDAVLLWALHPHVDTGVLCVLHLAADSARAAADVLSVAVHHAARFGLGSVEAYVTDGWTWDADTCVTLLGPEWKRESPRDESLSSLMLWRDGSVVADSRDEVVWHGNEKYAWI
ncbi:hypothetical protein AMAG_05599 [Allomyces macrogynus ATCC 38327]|uniref:LYC1 C-terminal domain-containing protein n=1 Tax=Allomyces macrogynus (strain ATCC 38327) TaxID=578462 RepID=A0A0L0SCR2_ALLM3|nr:hypothetical protein AMAG_05599 [Allomyces macrogynus ATCC 38327]|eukprot:KNE60180.1 hypothetical protein AMAG_05599 [Allomyces macrogynus ATCC 38327]